MNTTTASLARPVDDVLSELLPGSAIETRSATPAAPGAAAPADPVAALAASIDRQTDAIMETRTRQPAAAAAPTLRARITEARQAAQEAQARRLADMRTIAEREERAGRRGGADPLDREQRTRISAAMDRTDAESMRDLNQRLARLERENRALRRPAGPTGGQAAVAERRADPRQFAIRCTLQYLRTGQETFGNLHLREIQRRARFDTRAFADSGDNAGAGYLVVPERDATMESLEKPLSPMRQLATVRTIGTSELQRVVNKHGVSAFWDGEDEDSGEISLGLLKFPAMNLRSDPVVPQDMLEDPTMSLDAYLQEEGDLAFAEKESAAYYAGDGINRPKGLLSYTAVADASWAWGKVGYLATGASGDFASSGPGDVLRRLPLHLKQGMRNGATWLMQRSTIGAVRTIKDTTGQYLWANGDLSKGLPNTLDGYPVNEDEHMPEIAADAHAIGFGNWKRAYVIVDRIGFAVLRNPYKSPGNVIFHMRKRVGGGVQNFEAFKTVKFGTS